MSYGYGSDYDSERNRESDNGFLIVYFILMISILSSSNQNKNQPLHQPQQKVVKDLNGDGVDDLVREDQKGHLTLECGVTTADGKTNYVPSSELRRLHPELNNYNFMELEKRLNTNRKELYDSKKDLTPEKEGDGK